MPGRYSGRRRTFSRSIRPVINSRKIMPNAVQGLPAGANTVFDCAIAKDNPVTTTQNDVEIGSKIFRLWLEFWAYGQASGATNNILDAYIIKNPGDNLTEPNPGTVGTSNEKKFVFKTWKGLMGTKTEGGQPYMWRGWIKVPKVYQRMGADDRISVVYRSATIGDVCTSVVLKYYT